MKLYELVTSGAIGDNVIPKRFLKQEPIRFNPYLDFLSQFKKEEVEKAFVNEELEYIKFKYNNYKNDKNPRVKVLDFKYPGIKGQKTYGQREDVLGWNINYVEGGKEAKKEAKDGIDDIADFTDLLGGNNREKYERIVTMFPQAAEFLRRYMKKHIVDLKHKPHKKWKRVDMDKLTNRGMNYV